MGNHASSRSDSRNARSKHLGGQLGEGAVASRARSSSQEQSLTSHQSNARLESNSSAAGSSAAVLVAASHNQQHQSEQERSRQQSTWSLGSLSGRLNWSFTGATRNSFRNRNKSTSRKSFSALQQRRSKTTWHRPLTNAIFSSHFKETSRNEQFHIDRLVAKGAFGVVFKVIDKQQQQQQQLFINGNTKSPEQLVYALKVLKKSKIIEESSVQQIKEEADIQKLCGHHPFIVQQIDLWQNRRNLHILSEYVPNGELFSKIASFSIDLIRLYLAEIALAIDFLHNAGIIYRDAKPENILLTETFHIKLTDFGLSKWLKLGATTKTMCGTFQYMAPEILRGERYGHAVDWWSLGIIACQMFTDRNPDIQQLVDATFSARPTASSFDVTDEAVRHAPHENPPSAVMCSKLQSPDFLPVEVESLPHAAKDVIERLLEFNPRQRIRSVLALQRIALYKNYKIDAKHLHSLSPLDIMSKDNICVSTNDHELEESSIDASKAFHGF